MKSEDSKTNPWLSIPASDYEGHMSSPLVMQLGFLNGLFEKLMKRHRPENLAVAGCTTGNGFEHIDFMITKRVVAIDINPEYLEIVRERYDRGGDMIETICADVNACGLEPGSMDLVHCALLFEYVDPAVTLATVTRWLKPSGLVSVVLQLEDEMHGKVTETTFTSLKRLETIMRLVDPREFGEITAGNGLRPEWKERVSLPNGKRFFVAVYRSA